MGESGFFLWKLCLVFRHIDSTQVEISRGLKFNEHSGEFFFMRGLLFWDVDFASPVVRLFVGNALLDDYVPRYLYSSTFGLLLLYSADIIGIRIFVRDLAQSA